MNFRTAVLLASAGALLALSGCVAGIERREDRREDRQDRREERRDFSSSLHQQSSTPGWPTPGATLHKA